MAYSTAGGIIVLSYESLQEVRLLFEDTFRTTVDKIGDRKFELHHKICNRMLTKYNIREVHQGHFLNRLFDGEFIMVYNTTMFSTSIPVQPQQSYGPLWAS